jgi:hypothetical protein
MSASKRIEAFLTLASEELGAAKILAGSAPRQAAYYVQQAAEKATRAHLTAAGVPFGAGHNLGLCPHFPQSTQVGSSLLGWFSA